MRPAPADLIVKKMIRLETRCGVALVWRKKDLQSSEASRRARFVVPMDHQEVSEQEQAPANRSLSLAVEPDVEPEKTAPQEPVETGAAGAPAIVTEP